MGGALLWVELYCGWSFIVGGHDTYQHMQCCHNIFGNFQITRLCYPKFLATKNPNNNFMRNNILKCVHSIYTRL